MKEGKGINTHKEGENAAKAKKTTKISEIIGPDGKLIKTATKRQPNRVGKGDGKVFSKDYQPDPKKKSEGWKKLRAQRLLTQAIVKEMVGEDGISTENFKQFIKSLATNAKKGNAKAIEVIVKAMEDDVQKIAMTDAEGNDKDFVMRIGKVDL